MLRLSLFAVLLASASIAAAQTPDSATPNVAPAGPGSGEMRARLLALDTDRDGRWSKAEWLAGGRRERGFELIDSDDDGYLSPAELKAGAEKFQRRR